MPELINQSVVLPSGNRAVYWVPQRIVMRQAELSVAPDVAARLYGRQVAHKHGGRWYQPYGWLEITDSETVALLEEAPDA